MSTLSQHDRRLDAAVSHCVHELWNPPGAAVGLCSVDGLAWSRCFGERRLNSGLAVDEHTVFALASGTKTFAAASLAHLLGRGRLGWDSRVVDIDPTFDAGDAAVTSALTLRDLACHRIGWRSSEGRHRGAALSRADLVRRLRYSGFRHPFRRNFAYCTDGFSVLGHVVDTATGLSWERYAQTHLLAPLSMNRTSFFVADAESSNNFAEPHLQLADASRVAVPWFYEDGVATPAGGANSCLADLAKWLGAWLANGEASTPWPSAQTAIMQTPQIADAGPFADKELSCAVSEGLTDEAYALGWYTHLYRGERIFHHTGSIRGFRSMLALLPERQLGFIALVNANDVYLPRALFQATLDTLQGADPLRWTASFLRLEKRWHALNAGKYRRDSGAAAAATDTDLVGCYLDDGRFGNVTISAGDRGLQFRAGKLLYRVGQTARDLFPRDLFRCEEACGALVIDQGQLRAQRDDANHIVGFAYQGAAFKRTA